MTNCARSPTWTVYPRPRGGAFLVENRQSEAERLRSIPAHAGEPVPFFGPCAPIPVYPRPRGGAKFLEKDMSEALRSIPAHAGEPAPRSDDLEPLIKRSIPAHAGEPDRDSDDSTTLNPGSIPAHAGEPDRGSETRQRSPGLSPPTRGSPIRSWIAAGSGRSIPAHAGEPMSRADAVVLPGVYPRPRGGAASTSVNQFPVQGLSPPTRGSQPQPIVCDEKTRVYPRPRGGAYSRANSPILSGGLSPPTRGSHPYWAASCRTTRSIPAHAGEPTEDLPPSP